MGQKRKRDLPTNSMTYNWHVMYYDMRALYVHRAVGMPTSPSRSTDTSGCDSFAKASRALPAWCSCQYMGLNSFYRLLWYVEVQSGQGTLRNDVGDHSSFYGYFPFSLRILPLAGCFGLRVPFGGASDGLSWNHLHRLPRNAAVATKGRAS